MLNDMHSQVSHSFSGICPISDKVRSNNKSQVTKNMQSTGPSWICDPMMLLDELIAVYHKGDMDLCAIFHPSLGFHQKPQMSPCQTNVFEFCASLFCRCWFLTGQGIIKFISIYLLWIRYGNPSAVVDQPTSTSGHLERVLVAQPMTTHLSLGT